MTTPIWDRLLGSYEEPGVVTVPRRMAPVWMLDADGEVHDELAGDYIVKGAGAAEPDQVERDRVDAFSNVPPAA